MGDCVVPSVFAPDSVKLGSFCMLAEPRQHIDCRRDRLDAQASQNGALHA
jgi:hypothetical protein